MLASVDVYSYPDKFSRDLRITEGATFCGTASSATELDRITSEHKGPFGYFAKDVPLQDYEHALETLGVDPQVYLS